MYKRYLEPDSIDGTKIPTKYILKKLKQNENIPTYADSVENNSFVIDVGSQEECTENLFRNGEVSDGDIVNTTNGLQGNQENAMRVDEEQSSENDIENSDDNFFNSVTDELIHPNLECKISDAVLMILSFFLQHQLTWVALEDLLKLFYHVLGDNSQFPKTKYFFKKCFGGNDRGVFHFYCKHCDLYIGTFEDVSEMNDLENIDNENVKEKHKFKKCLNCEQVFSLNKLNDGYFFIQLPIRPQIEEKLKNDTDIQNFNTSSNSNNCITDIFDCDLYKSLKSKIGNLKLLTLTLNTDGVRVFKSKAKSSLWPIQMFLNEVPLNKRFKQENIILVGISFGKDPDFNVYMRPLIQELKMIDQDKMKLNLDNCDHEIALRVFLVSSDSPARCKMMKLKQYNGEFGCTYCLRPGNTFEDSNVSKYLTSKGKYPLRTHASTVKLMKEFLETAEGRFGIIGVSPLLGFADFDLIRGTVVDYMHAVLLGVVCLLLNLWFDSENHFEKYYVTPRGMESVNKNIRCMQPPRFFSRQPRIIDEKQFWKANEFRSWLLYYAVPCLKDTLKETYLRHFSLLSEAIFIFLKTEISADDFRKASKNLENFTLQFEMYYGKSNMMYNVHLLEHLSKCVKDCGPLWAYSNFNFESSNGFLVKHVKGTTNVEHQLAEKYFLNNALNDLKKRHASVNALNYIDQRSNKRVKKFKKVGLITLFGKPRKYNLNNIEKLILQQSKILSYKKLFCRNEVYYSSKFKKSKRRNDTAIRLKDGTFGQISLIYEKNEAVFLILKKLRTISVQYGPEHLKKVITEVADEYYVVHTDDISEKCILIQTLKELYISPFANRFESD